jgi:hypothetical protein
MHLEYFLDTPPWDWPTDSGKTFLKVLDDNKAAESERLIAAQLAGDLTVISDKLAKALLEVATSVQQAEALRVKAAIALGPVLELADTSEFDEFDEMPISRQTFETIKSTLKKLCLDESAPKQVRRYTLETSVRAPEDWHVEPVRTAYASGDGEWLLTAVYAMNHVAGFDKEILASLDHPDPDVQCLAITAAGVWEVSAAWPHIRAVAQDRTTSKSLLLAALEAICGLRPPDSESILLELSESTDEDIHEAAGDALMMLRGMQDDDFDDEDEATEWIN